MIFLDALSLHSGGARTHLRHLLAGPDGPAATLLTTHTIWESLRAGPHVTPMFAPEATRKAFMRAAWRRWNLAEALRSSSADLYFDPAGGAPALPVPRVTMVRNMLPFDEHVPQWYGRATYQGQRLAALRLRSVSIASSADGVIFISEWSRKTVTAQLQRASAFSCVIPHGVVPREAVAATDRPLRLLYVSDVEPYKRQVETVLAYDAARRQGAALGGLALAGSFTYPPYERRLRSVVAGLRHGSEIELAGWLDKGALEERMRAADAFVFASSVECCPNILLECLSAGKPVICSAAPPMPEFAEDAAVYVDAADPSSIADGLRRVARMSPLQREELGRRGAALTRRRDWATTAKRTWEFLAEVAGRGRAR